MNGTISVLSFHESTSSAALIGSFGVENAAFLSTHLDELAGDVLLECQHLDELDVAAARVLHAFRKSRDRQGFWVFFRGIQPRCREQLLDRAREESFRQHPAGSVERASQPVLAGHVNVRATASSRFGSTT